MDLAASDKQRLEDELAEAAAHIMHLRAQGSAWQSALTEEIKKADALEMQVRARAQVCVRVRVRVCVCVGAAARVCERARSSVWVCRSVCVRARARVRLLACAGVFCVCGRACARSV